MLEQLDQDEALLVPHLDAALHPRQRRRRGVGEVVDRSMDVGQRGIGGLKPHMPVIR